MAKKKSKSAGIPQIINPTSEKIDKLASEIAEKQKSYASDRSAQYDKTWEKALKYYENRAGEKSFDWQSNVFAPLTYTHCRTIFPRLKKTIIGKIPAIKIVGLPDSALEKYLAMCLRKNKGYLQMSDALWESTIYGTSIMKCWWDSDYAVIGHDVPKITPGKNIIERAMAEASGQVDDRLEYEHIEEIITLVDQPVIQWVPLWNFYCNGNESASIDEVDCFEIMDVDLNFLKMRSKDEKLNPNGFRWGVYDNVDLIAALESIVPTSGDDPQNIIRDIRNETIPRDKNRKFTIRLIHGQLDFEYNNTFYRNGIVTVAQVQTKKNVHNVTLRVAPCPRSDGRKNYIKVCYERIPGRFYGRGIPEILAPMQEIYNDFLRAQIDRDTLALHRPMAFDVNRIDDPSLLQIRMGGLMPVNGPPNELINEIKIDPTHPGSWTVLETLSMLATELTGAHKNLAGTAEGAPNRTASGIMALMQASTERILDTARDMAEEFIYDLGSALIRVTKDNLHRKIEFTHLNNNGREEKVILDGSTIPNGLEAYSPTLYERADKEQQAQKILQSLQYTAALIGEENLNALMRVFWQYNELPDIDNLFQPSQQTIPLELVAMTLQGMGIPPAVFMAKVNQMAMQQSNGNNGGGGNGGGNQSGAAGGGSASNLVPSRNQGTAQMPVGGPPNAGRRMT